MWKMQHKISVKCCKSDKCIKQHLKADVGIGVELYQIKCQYVTYRNVIL